MRHGPFAIRISHFGLSICTEVALDAADVLGPEVGDREGTHLPLMGSSLDDHIRGFEANISRRVCLYRKAQSINIIYIYVTRSY